MKRMYSHQYVFFLLFVLTFLGCEQPQEIAPTEQIMLNATIGSVAQYYAIDTVGVRGIGIVAGLAGTGSSECPPKIRQELEKYIWQQIPEGGSNPRALISSLDTAVVEISGVIPALSTTREVFDVQLRPLSSTQTTSLDGGYLYTTELEESTHLSSVDQFTRFSKTLASAEGPVYSLKQEAGTQKNWYVLGGGRTLQDSNVKLILNNSDFRTANMIRNRINERFGPKIATPVSKAEITIAYPVQYSEQKQHFLNMVESLLIANNPDIREEYIQTLIARLLSKTDSEGAATALEGIGRPALDQLAVLLEHDDPEIRFHAARCMLRIGDSRPITCLRTIINDSKSPYRIEAISTVGLSAKYNDALSLLTPALNDSDVQVRLKAYKMLVRLSSPQISRKIIANGAFVVDNVVCSGPKMVYVYRTRSPRIVIFGSPVYCEKNVFIQSDDGTTTINAQSNDKYIAVSRKNPNRPGVIGPLSSSHELSGLIQTLGELPETQASRRPGLAVPYAQIVSLLEKMASQNAISAQFIEGPGPDLEPVLQNFSPN